MVYQPALKQIITAFFKTYDKISDLDREAFSDRYHIPIWRDLLHGFDAREPSRSDVSKYISEGTSDSFCMLFSKNFELFSRNLRSVLNKQIHQDFHESFYNSICAVIKEQCNPYIRKDLQSVDKTCPTYSDKIIKAFEMCCKVFANDTDDALLIRNYQVKDNEKLVGRDKELDLMKMYMGNGYVILYGEDGIGKTELAKKYLARYRSEYDLMIYVGYRGSVNGTVDAIPATESAHN